ncbi:hypothetical protein FCH28_30130 [Streptomyces piniterrae]|uniref:DUF3592 domain-containing protein n=1 Tax=Streptomyces piniterrae TaxID=2571125 RepID=A0A4V5MI99_9ACTN|nr:hypothetical protein [Streptomyces piniterrae]TJZ44588.1 hypothetical protein FCH28_30130 [Streptomyces piniterrae]
MSSGISRKQGNGRQGEPKPAWGWRVVGLLIGFALALIGVGGVIVNGIQGVQATGLVGTRGTFTVDYCSDTNPSGKNSDYECRGTFAAPAEDGGDRWRGTLENAEDYPTGENLDVVEGWVGSSKNFRETGVGATLGSVMWLCFALISLAMGVAQLRKWARSFKK